MIRRVALVALLSIVSVQTVYASSFGRTPGKFGVSPIGSAQYSIPIWTPPGPTEYNLTWRSGMTVELALGHLVLVGHLPDWAASHAAI